MDVEGGGGYLRGENYSYTVEFKALIYCSKKYDQLVYVGGYFEHLIHLYQTRALVI